MNQIKISGYGSALPQKTIQFEHQTRYRISGDETQLSLAVRACKKALTKASLAIDEIDLIVSASAVGIQPIPCTAALIHEKIAIGTSIPAMDINTTCTSFVTALDTVSYFLAAKKYRRVLIVSSETGSLGLNPNQRESYELFSDGAAAFVLEATQESIGVIHSLQQTWSQGAHSTEIRGGLTGFHPKFYSASAKEEYMFDMTGKSVLSLTIKKVPAMFLAFMDQSNLALESVDMVIPHQASRALPLLMKKMGIAEDRFLNLVDDYGNMVSVSIPFTLCYAFENNRIHPGNTILLVGTAAGLTTNMLALKI